MSQNKAPTASSSINCDGRAPDAHKLQTMAATSCFRGAGSLFANLAAGRALPNNGTWPSPQVSPGIWRRLQSAHPSNKLARRPSEPVNIQGPRSRRLVVNHQLQSASCSCVVGRTAPAIVSIINGNATWSGSRVVVSLET